MGQGSELVWLGMQLIELHVGGSHCWGGGGLSWGRTPIQVPLGLLAEVISTWYKIHGTLLLKNQTGKGTQTAQSSILYPPPHLYTMPVMKNKSGSTRPEKL